MTAPTLRIEQYYNALIGHGRPGVAPTINEARRDLHRAAHAEVFHSF